MNVIIVSYNRGCQLELLLRSINEFWKDCPKINVLYKYDNNDYKKGYDLIFNYYDKDIKLIPETNFKYNVMLNINPSEKYTMFLTDDDVFKESWAMDSEYFSYFDKYDLLGISLRMHPRMNFCYTKLKKMELPHFEYNMWEWKMGELEWNYAMSIDGTVFLTSDIFPILSKYDFQNPNTMEKTLAMHPIDKRLLVCYDKSKIINIPLNRVQKVWANQSMQVKTDYLNERFLKGDRISLDNIRGIDNESPHKEIQIQWIEVN